MQDESNEFSSEFKRKISENEEEKKVD